MEVAPHISVDRTIHHGATVISGTRVPVSIVLGSLAGGMTKAQVMREYELSQEQVGAALAYAAQVVSDTEVTPVTGG